MFLINSIKIIITLLSLITIFNNCKLLNASELPHVYCKMAFILVELQSETSNHSNEFYEKIYWENLSFNAPKECHLWSDGQSSSLKILLQDSQKCGFVKSVNKWKHQVSFYQNLIIKQNTDKIFKIPIKCSYKMKTLSSKFKHKVVKRDTLPEDFQEEGDLEILETIEQRAPEPEVLMEVRQNGELIDGMVTIIPGTPLVMEIKLNEIANQIYGLKVNFLEVTDMADTSETILYKGCTVDPYLFENFNLTDTNSLKSKFRAFKFPNTAYVQFRANVQICLKTCTQSQCIGSHNNKENRKKRELNPQIEDFYEVHTRFILKLNTTFKSQEADFIKLQNHVKLLHEKSQQQKHQQLHHLLNHK
ncbi:uncharacterized protein ACRADG_010097 [Cochliomyia hominivorax]